MIGCKYADPSSFEDLPLMSMDDNGLVELEGVADTDDLLTFVGDCKLADGTELRDITDMAEDEFVDLFLRGAVPERFTKELGLE